MPGFRDIVTSHLKEDARINASVLGVRRIFRDAHYEIFICVYSGLMGSKSLHQDLVACLAVFKEENLRVLFKLWAEEIRGDRNAYIEKAVEALEAQGRSPRQMLRDAKSWCRIPLTNRDQTELSPRISGAER
ncbi:MAG: hypothetical protein ACXWPM_09700 [Bdellovibrionota bacterium]